MKKTGLLIIGFVFLQLTSTEVTSAQWGFGVAVEIKDQDPTTGLGLKLEREFFSNAPVVDFNLRGHFSWFYDNDVDGIFDEAFRSELNVYDYGAALVIGVHLGLVKPYIGGGVGREHYREESRGGILNFSEESIYWNGFGGAEITLLPYLKPFIEFRYSRLTDTDEIEFDSYNRLAIGVNFRF